MFASVAACAVLAGSAAGQYPVQQDGRLFDANPSLGYGGTNYARPASPLLSGNLAAYGNIGRGLSLRIDTGVNNPFAFHGSLGSGALSVFRRDTVSVADRTLPGGALNPRPYYDLTNTVPTAGFLRGTQGFGAPLNSPSQIPRLSPTPGSGWGALSQSGPGGPLDIRPLDLRIPSVSPTAANPSSILGWVDTERSNDLASGIFGVQPPQFRSPAQELEARLSAESERMGRPGIDEPVPDAYLTEGGMDVPGSTPPLGTPLDYLQRNEPGRLSTIEGPLMPEPIDVRGELNRTESGMPRSVQLTTPPEGADEPALRDPSMLPGYDVFSNLQIALSLQQQPNAEWFEEMQSAIRANPSVAGEIQPYGEIEPDEFVQTVMNTSLDTFVGNGRSALNNALLRAESLMDLGQYFEASGRYDEARALDPANPLPLIGKGNAMLAAGNYQSAALFLTDGFERFPDLARFTINLKALIGGGEVIDIRRADIMQQLKHSDDPRLWFLLGYLEYFSGDRDRGLQNLKTAAEKAAANPQTRDSIIVTFPRLLPGGVAPAPGSGQLPEAAPPERLVVPPVESEPPKDRP